MDGFAAEHGVIAMYPAPGLRPNTACVTLDKQIAKIAKHDGSGLLYDGEPLGIALGRYPLDADRRCL